MFRKTVEAQKPVAESLLQTRIRAVASGRASSAGAQFSGTERCAGRVATFQQAEIVLRGGESIPVAVKNVSETGVRVNSYRILDLPEVVFFRGVGRGELLKARVVRKERHSAALQFIDGHVDAARF